MLWQLIAAQFFGCLADNALLFVAIAMLLERRAADWMTPALRLFFYLSYVLLAPFAGAMADRVPKGRLIVWTNLVKLAGCALLLLNLHPLLAYAVIGIGAAAHGPARYGILPEVLPAEKLVAANAWLETVTVVASLLGVALGSGLAGATLSMPGGLPETPHLTGALQLLAALYGLATVCTVGLRALGKSSPAALAHPRALTSVFFRSLKALAGDPDGGISLAVTSLFWAVAAVLQFIVLRWAAVALQMSLAQAALLQGVVALGMIAGALIAARRIALDQVIRMLPAGLLIGALLMALPVATSLWLAILLLLAIGMLAGVLLIPMNALMQHRGDVLMATGQSIAVQHFSECLASLVLLGIYGALLAVRVPLSAIVLGLGVLVIGAMLMIIRRSQASPPRSLQPGPPAKTTFTN